MRYYWNDRKHFCRAFYSEGLRRLEYRGYDSAGIAVLNQGTLDGRRAAGKIAKLENELRKKPLEGNTGIGHTRWATHGVPNVVNAHPHVSGSVSVVHNGIIENHKQLKEELVSLGFAMETETDTEVAAHLVKYCLLYTSPSPRDRTRSRMPSSA